MQNLQFEFRQDLPAITGFYCFKQQRSTMDLGLSVSRRCFSTKYVNIIIANWQPFKTSTLQRGIRSHLFYIPPYQGTHQLLIFRFRNVRFLVADHSRLYFNLCGVGIKGERRGNNWPMNTIIPDSTK